MPQSSRWPVAQELHEMLLSQTYMYLYTNTFYSQKYVYPRPTSPSFDRSAVDCQ